MFRGMVQDVLNYLDGVNEFIQTIGVFILSLIPFVESPGGAAIGILVGLPVIWALVISVIGNWLSIMAIVIPYNAWLVRYRNSDQRGFIHRRTSRAKARYEKYGVPGVALLAPLIASGHIAAFGSLAAGANKSTVVFWHVVSIIVWGVIGAALGFYLKTDVFS
ncbi:small multi-drug export protein [Alkalibacillus salilacus]|uniref:Membrane protein n=1 Tax=Alkalibacillus salilacus TaxID=284582 RepID=A0ABT9VES0_9BACI|nr:small multi-drug export protein [Alkalibacillus salilacus]MDQ0159461.1 putative membrane protein [Alkalibacillus salilacus]